MRTALIFALGLIGLVISTQSATAEQVTCSTEYTVCFDAASGITRSIERCATNYRQCMNDGSWGTVVGPGTYLPSLESSTASAPGTEM